MDFDLPPELLDLLAELDTFIAHTIKPIEEQDEFVWLPYEVLDRRAGEPAVTTAGPDGAIALPFPARMESLPGESPTDWLIPHLGNRAENAA